MESKTLHNGNCLPKEEERNGQGHDNDVEDDDVVIDFRPTPLNACSIETYSSPITIRTQDGGEEHDHEEIVAFPLCLGCYELDESTQERNGRLDLYSIPLIVRSRRTDKSNTDTCSTVLSFGSTPPLTLLGRKTENSSTSSAAANASGVLDGKWFEPALVGPGARLSDDDFFGHYASAHADGRILVHGVSSYKRPSSLDSDSSGTCHSPFQAMLLGESESPSDKDALCLALAWDNKDYKDMSHGANGTTANSDRATTPKTIDTRILSSYSDGHVAIHRIKSSSSSSTTTDDTSTARPRVDVTLEHHWEAHTLFRSHPAEVWCCNFLLQRQYYSAMDLCSEMTPPTPIVATGGDEGSWKGWDVRVGLTRPIFHESDIFGAGVTVISPHPRHDHIVAVGSYDETIALYDVRKLSSTSPPQVLHHSDPLGGGIWRCKWHPHDDDRLLVGAMHGGCQAVQYSASIFKASCDNSATTSTGQKDDDDGEIRFSIRQKFTKHQSMAYGADWIWYCLDTAEEEEERESFTIVEAAASCSFYDRSMYLWKVTQEW